MSWFCLQHLPPGFTLLSSRSSMPDAFGLNILAGYSGMNFYWQRSVKISQIRLREWDLSCHFYSSIKSLISTEHESRCFLLFLLSSDFLLDCINNCKGFYNISSHILHIIDIQGDKKIFPSLLWWGFYFSYPEAECHCMFLESLIFLWVIQFKIPFDPQRNKWCLIITSACFCYS